jgi:hypothetical protein
MSDSNTAVVSRPRLWRRYFWISLAGILILVVSVVGWMLYRAATFAIQAERNLHDTLFAIQLVEQFVNDDGHWPRSWAELEQLPFPSKTPSPLNVQHQPFKSWPAASKHLQECVAIDFQADPEQIARQDPMKFEAIKPIGPYYEFRNYGYVASLQETLQTTLRKVINFSDLHLEFGNKQTSGLYSNDTSDSRAMGKRDGRQRLTPHSQVPEAIDRGMMLDAKMDELKMPSVYPRQESIHVSPQAPPSFEEIPPSPSPDNR